MRNDMPWLRRAAFASLVPLCLSACASYTTPGGAANFESLGLTPEAKAAMTDNTVQEALNKKPLVTFPVTIAVVRVQANDYEDRYHGTRHFHGNYAVVSTREVEKEEDFKQVAGLPQVAHVAPIRRVLLEGTLNSDKELRTAAAKLHANLTLYYTFDTQFTTETHVRPLGVITLGLAPNKMANVRSTASAVLMDTNNGFVYMVCEQTSEARQLTNAWESKQSMDEAGKRAERDAFEKLIKSFKEEWPTFLATYQRPGGARSAEAR